MYGRDEPPSELEIEEERAGYRRRKYNPMDEEPQSTLSVAGIGPSDRFSGPAPSDVNPAADAGAEDDAEG